MPFRENHYEDQGDLIRQLWPPYIPALAGATHSPDSEPKPEDGEQ
jgi:hypothetical protein